MKAIARALCTLCAVLGGTILARAETAYFLMGGPLVSGGTKQQSYVVATSDLALIRQAREHLASSQRRVYLVPLVEIASGGSPENVNHAEPGHPAWTWHATGLRRWVEFDPSLPRLAVYLPNVDGPPASVPDLLAEGYTSMSLVNFPLTMEIRQSCPGRTVNLSTRGHVGEGERVLIGGLIVEGGQPRNLFIRARGPSLAQFGVQEPLRDPKITLYRGGEAIAENDSWRTTILGQLFPPPWIQTFAPPPLELAWMVPESDAEPVLWLSLPPGAYTVHVSGQGGSTGIALIEVFDLDAMKPD
jgi:hypothetical protein